MIKTLTLGYAGEYGARMMAIDLSEEAAMWPDAAAQLLLVRPGEHTPYPADNAVYADGCMTFTPTKADMAIAGQGYAQVYFYGADGNVLGKSRMMITHILASLGGDSTEPPSGDELGYYDKLMQQAALAIAAGASAKEDAQSAAESAAKAEAALEEMKNISTQSGNMPDGGSPGQILAKKSAENYDTHWIDPPSGSGTGGGVADSVAWDNVTDKPSTYPPAAHTHPEYLGKNETAANATQLNGKSADQYMLKTDTAADSYKLDGKDSVYFHKKFSHPRNLLDNSYWENPKEIVNQREQTSYTGANVYMIDRWFIGTTAKNATLQITEGGIVLSSDEYADFNQNFENYDSMKGKTYTIGICTSDRSIYVKTFVMGDGSGGEFGPATVYSLDERNLILRFYESTTLIWAALYEGEYTADNLPPYVPKGYAAELAECLMYYYPYGSLKLLLTHNADGVDRGTFLFPTKMRIIPTLTYEITGDVDAQFTLEETTKQGFSCYANGVKACVQIVNCIADADL